MLPKEWETLNWVKRSRVIGYLIIEFLKQIFEIKPRSPFFISLDHFNRLPRPIRFAVLHAGITFATASTFPPAIELPAIIVPILWAGSFALTYSLMALARI